MVGKGGPGSGAAGAAASAASASGASGFGLMGASLMRRITTDPAPLSEWLAGCWLDVGWCQCCSFGYSSRACWRLPASLPARCPLGPAVRNAHALHQAKLVAAQLSYFMPTRACTHAQVRAPGPSSLTPPPSLMTWRTICWTWMPTLAPALRPSSVSLLALSRV